MVYLGELLRWAEQMLIPLGPDEARANAEGLLMELTGLSRSDLYLQSGRTLEAGARKDFETAVNSRLDRIPLAYLTGKAYFWDLTLEVGPACLIPRQETEVLVEKFIEKAGFGREDAFTFLDLCAGSGAIGIAVMRSFPNSRAFFADISPEALEITVRNLRRYGLEERAITAAGDLFQPFLNRGISFDAVLCNPPYLSAADWMKVQPELLKEPRLALDGGTDGLDFYRRITAEAASYLNENGLLFFEFGIGQSEDIKKLVESRGFSSIEIFRDYLDIPRVIMGCKAI